MAPFFYIHYIIIAVTHFAGNLGSACGGMYCTVLYVHTYTYTYISHTVVLSCPPPSNPPPVLTLTIVTSLLPLSTPLLHYFIIMKQKKTFREYTAKRRIQSKKRRSGQVKNEEDMYVYEKEEKSVVYMALRWGPFGWLGAGY